MAVWVWAWVRTFLKTRPLYGKPAPTTPRSQLASPAASPRANSALTRPLAPLIFACRAEER